MSDIKDILTKDDIERDNLDDDDLNLIDEEMNEAIDEFKQEIEEAIKNDKESEKEIDEMLSTDDIDERLKIWKKYHPNEDLVMNERD